MKSLLTRILFVIAATLGAASFAQAQDLSAVKARMEQRQGAVDTLKDRQAVGETNRGFLEVRGTVSPQEQQTVSEENSDRAAVYAALAAQTKTDPDTVGRQRAQQIALRSKRGVWIQQPSGEWIQKG